MKSETMCLKDTFTLSKVYTINILENNAMPSATKFMSMEEFFDLICRTGVVDETFGQREIGI